MDGMEKTILIGRISSVVNELCPATVAKVPSSFACQFFLFPNCVMDKKFSLCVYAYCLSRLLHFNTIFFTTEITQILISRSMLPSSFFIFNFLVPSFLL